MNEGEKRKKKKNCCSPFVFLTMHQPARTMFASSTLTLSRVESASLLPTWNFTVWRKLSSLWNWGDSSKTLEAKSSPTERRSIWDQRKKENKKRGYKKKKPSFSFRCSQTTNDTSYYFDNLQLKQKNGNLIKRQRKWGILLRLVGLQTTFMERVLLWLLLDLSASGLWWAMTRNRWKKCFWNCLTMSVFAFFWWSQKRNLLSMCCLDSILEVRKGSFFLAPYGWIDCLFENKRKS